MLEYFKGFMKYKYYFRKPKSTIVKDIFYWLAIAGTIYTAASSPYFVQNLLKNFRRFRKYQSRKVSAAFYRLKKEGCIKIERKRKQFFVSLTKKGKEKAGWLQIDALKIKKPKKWDKKWRLVIFDISQLKKFFRELFRGKLKQLGFYQLQKSVWVHAFDCRDEIEVLKEFFGLKEHEVRLVIAEDIGNNQKLKDFFKLE